MTLDDLEHIPELIARLEARVSELERELAAAKGEDLLSVTEAASLLHCTPRTLQNKVRDGVIHPVKLGKSRPKYSRAELLKCGATRIGSD